MSTAWGGAVTASVDLDVETLEDVLGVPVGPTAATTEPVIDGPDDGYRYARSSSTTTITAIRESTPRVVDSGSDRSASPIGDAGQPPRPTRLFEVTD